MRETPDATIEKSQAKSKRKSGEAGLPSPASLKRNVSPPPFNPGRCLSQKTSSDSVPAKSDSARVEAGEVEINDHVTFFSTKLHAAAQPRVEGQPRLSHSDWLALYHRNLNDRGRHFVVHQHDHPVAGTHYDLRLQCNATSSISFALPYGLPGDPNSRRLNRFAIETRVHNLWNHLIETASYETGTMLLWDTGEYEVIPYDSSGKSSSTENATASEGSGTDSDDAFSTKTNMASEPQKLHHAFQRRKIKLRLRGTRLPSSYTISIRLLQENNSVVQPAPPAFKRRKTETTKDNVSSANPKRKSRAEMIDTSSDSSQPPSPISLEETKPAPSSPASLSTASARTPSPTGESFDSLDHSLQRKKDPPKLKRSVSSLLRTASPPPPRRSTSAAPFHDQLQRGPIMTQFSSPSQTQQDPRSTRTQSQAVKSPPAPHPPQINTPTWQHLDDSTTETPSALSIRQQNAYPGALNTINSIHQRKWFLSLDRSACGFRPTSEFAFGRRVWERGDDESGFETFYVQGRDVERSILTGRLAADVARDEGLMGYKPRGGWKGITD